MASKQEHLDTAARNQAFLDKQDDSFPEWLAVVAFYKAVHLVEALFATESFHSKRHHERNRRLQTQHPDIWTHFKPLFDVSRQVRYDNQKISVQDVRRHLIEHRLAQVERLVTSKIAASAPAKKPTGPRP